MSKSGLPTNKRKMFMRDDWFHTRPTVIKVLAKKLKPWKKYMIKETGQTCMIVAYNEAWTVTVLITGGSDPMRAMMEAGRLEVFGIKPSSLEIVRDADIVIQANPVSELVNKIQESMNEVLAKASGGVKL